MRGPEEPVCIHIFRQNPVFTSLHLKSPVHVVPTVTPISLPKISFDPLRKRSIIFLTVNSGGLQLPLLCLLLTLSSEKYYYFAILLVIYVHILLYKWIQSNEHSKQATNSYISTLASFRKKFNQFIP
jgi:hypothetical protein